LDFCALAPFFAFGGMMWKSWSGAAIDYATRMKCSGLYVL
jgi:hypothetical protein